MSTTIKTGWLEDNNGEKFAPRTITSQITTNDGTSLEQKIETDILNSINEAKEYTDEKVNVLNETIENKVEKIDGKGLSTNDYTDKDKEKIDAIGIISTSLIDTLFL